MTDIENKIINYVDTYYSPEELQIMKKYYLHNYNYDDTKENDIEYLNLSQLYKKLLNIKESDKYRVEVDDSCTSIIKKLFARYVNKDTFVISTAESHNSVKEYTNTVNPNNLYRFYISNKEHLSADIFDKIIAAYKKSGCTNAFIIIESTIVGYSYIIQDEFFEKLKNILSVNKIPFVLVLDDCQGIFNVKRNYDLYDCILATGHVIDIGFDMGILFTRLKDKIAHVNKTGLKRFYEKLEIVYKHRDKANQFNSLLSEYFQGITDNKFTIPEGLAPHHFTIHIQDTKLVPKYMFDLSNNYLFMFCETNAPKSWFKIRYHEFIIQDSRKLIEGLKQAKNVINKIKKYNQLKEIEPVDYSEYLNYDDFLMESRFNIENEFFHFKEQKHIEQARAAIRNTVQNNGFAKMYSR